MFWQDVIVKFSLAKYISVLIKFGCKQFYFDKYNIDFQQYN